MGGERSVSPTDKRVKHQSEPSEYSGSVKLTDCGLKQFENPVLEQINFNINPNFHAGETPVDMKNTFKTQVIKSEDENAALVKLEIYINVDKEDTPFGVQAVVSSNFTWEGLEPDVADKMLHTNAPALLFTPDLLSLI